MSLFAAQLIASAEVCADARRRLRVASDLTQVDIVERSEGTTGVDQFVLIERGKWPLLSKQCTAIAKAMDLTAACEAQLLRLALIDRAPERRNPMPHSARIDLMLHAFEAFLTAYLHGELQALLATLNTIAELWPHVKARRAHSSAQRRTAQEVSTSSPPTMHDSRRDV
jgi:hypothetical protein